MREKENNEEGLKVNIQNVKLKSVFVLSSGRQEGFILREQSADTVISF